MTISLAVCGDSWFSIDHRYLGRSFAELICARQNWRLMPLSRGGISNFVIALQIDKAIQSTADIVVVGTTTSDRIEVPLPNDDNLTVWKKLSQNLPLYWEDEQLRGFDKSRGLSNIIYHGATRDDIKDWIGEPTLLSNSLSNMMTEYCTDISADQRQAVRAYMMHLHDTHARKQMDAWIISDACRRLHAAKKPFIIFTEALYQNEFSQDIAWVDPKNVMRPADLAIWDLPRGQDTGFHYSLDAAHRIVEILEPRLLTLLKEKNTHA